MRIPAVLSMYRCCERFRAGSCRSKRRRNWEKNGGDLRAARREVDAHDTPKRRDCDRARFNRERLSLNRKQLIKLGDEATLQDGEIGKQRRSFPPRPSVLPIQLDRASLPTTSPPILAYLSLDCSRKRQRDGFFAVLPRRRGSFIVAEIHIYSGVRSAPSRESFSGRKNSGRWGYMVRLSFNFNFAVLAILVSSLYLLITCYITRIIYDAHLASDARSTKERLASKLSQSGTDEDKCSRERSIDNQILCHLLCYGFVV